MYFANVYFGTSIGGLMDEEFVNQPMSWAKFVSILEHLWIPVLVIGTSGTAGMIRTLRANLLDELQKQYVTTARAKGLAPFRALVKYPLRMSLNFFISDIGKILPQIPLGRLGQPEEVAGLIIYLASNEAAFVTGANISINGGQHMY